jgi:signal transduction histidine kinase
MVAALALFCVLVPLHVALYSTPVVPAILLGAALAGSALLALTRPRSASVLAVLAVWVLPLVSLQEGVASWPWPWSVPAMIAFALFVLVVTLVHGWRAGVVPFAIGTLGPLLATPMLGRSGTSAPDLIGAASATATVYVLAVLLASRLRVGQELDRAREVSAAEHERRLLVEERTRIARELHDVVAHSTALIQVQASTARYRIPDLAPEAAAEFEEIAAGARSSLAEMRRLLGVLRTEDHTPELAPLQGVADIPELVESFRRAGASVELWQDEPPAELPAGVDLTAYRVAQEALSNAVRHAPGARIGLHVAHGPEAVTLRVHNEVSPSPPPPSSPGHGTGLRGMRERVNRLDGTLEHGPAPEGGWTVLAYLPLVADPQESA